MGFWKFIFGLEQSAYLSATLGESGRLPLYTQYEKRYVKYWLKSPLMNFTKGDGSQILSKSYFQMVLTVCGLDHKLVTFTLSDRIDVTGPGYCHAKLESSTTLSTYSEFKSLLNPEIYLLKNENFRTSKIRTIIFRQKNFGPDFDISQNKEKFGQNKSEEKLRVLHVLYRYFEWTNHSS